MTQKCDGDGDEDADEDMLVLAATRASTKTTMKTVKNMLTVVVLFPLFITSSPASSQLLPG